MKPKSFLRHFLLGTAFLTTASSLQAQTNYIWDGDTSASFATAGNWSPSVAPTGGTSNSRISVNNGANNQLTYTASQGNTIYTGGGSGSRSLVIASGANGSMTITGGTFDSRQLDQDLIVNGQHVGSLTMNGGNYINTNGGGNIFHLGFNAGLAAGAQATLNMQSGNFTTGILQFGQSAGLNPGGLVSVANLDGGILTTNEIREGATAGTNVALASSTINFNGGTLRAGATNASFLSTGSVDNAVVQGNGAIIDTNNFNVTIGKALTAGTGSGGLTKQGAGTLTLTGTGNTFAGATVVKAGTLKLNTATTLSTSSTLVAGDTGSSGAVLDVTTAGLTVASTKTLAGIGSVLATGQTVTVNGKLAAGDGGAGALAISGVGGNLTMNTGSIFEWDLAASKDANGAGGNDGVAGTDFDSVSVTGNIAVASGSIFKVIFGNTVLSQIQDTNNAFWNTPYGTQTWNMSAIFGEAFASGGFTSVQTSNNVATYGSFSISNTALTWTAVPEPTSALAGLLIGAGLLRRRRN